MEEISSSCCDVGGGGVVAVPSTVVDCVVLLVTVFPVIVYCGRQMGGAPGAFSMLFHASWLSFHKLSKSNPKSYECNSSLAKSHKLKTNWSTAQKVITKIICTNMVVHAAGMHTSSHVVGSTGAAFKSSFHVSKNVSQLAFIAYAKVCALLLLIT